MQTFADQMQTFGIECKIINPTLSFGIESSAEICKLKTEYISTANCMHTHSQTLIQIGYNF